MVFVMKQIRLPIFLSFFFLASAVFLAHAEDDLSSAEEKAHQSHDLAMSDVIYEQENFKALYYQNEVIIQLLKEIREEMHASNVRDAKNTKA